MNESAPCRPASDRLLGWRTLTTFFCTVSFLTFASHELIGHALPARLQGANLHRVQVRGMEF